LKILIVSQYFWPEFLILNELARDLVSDGHEVTVLTAEPNYGSDGFYKDYMKNKDKYNEFLGVDIIRAKILPRKKGKINLILNYLSFIFSGCFTVYRKLSKRNFDVIFVFQSSPVTAALPAIFYRYLKKIPMILWVQDLWPDTLSAVGVLKNEAGLSIVGRLVSFIYKKTDLILCQSPAFEKNIINYNHTEVPVEYFPNWADDVFKNKVDESIETFNKEEGLFDIVFAGNIGEAQDIPAILDAVESLIDKPVRFIFVGNGSLYNWLNSAIKIRGLEKSILMLGRHPIESMPSFFQKADALLVSLSSKDIFSMTIPSKVQAYMSAGKPIVAMLNGIGAEIINNSGAGYSVDSSDSEGLSNVIAKLCDKNAEELEHIGNCGKIYYKKNFDKDMLRNKLTMKFKKLTNSNIGG
jgi:glycosyltransferase involved in cell wall biosynthesis